MALDVSLNTYKKNKLVPLIRPDLAPTQCVNLAPSTTYLRGTILGQVTAAGNAVQTISDSGTVSGGTFTISGTNPVSGAAFTTAAIAFDANNAALKAALEAVLLNGITVTAAGSGLPGNDTTLTFSGNAAGLPVGLMTISSASLTGTNPVLTVANTTTGRTAGTMAAYVGAGVTDPARAILPYDCITDSRGMISFSDATGGVWNEKHLDVDVYIGGTFATSELVGLDAGAVVDLGGSLVSGTTTNGVLRF